MDNKREIANVLYGLLDDVIFISKPQEAERKRLLETTLSAMRVSSDIDIEEISDKLNCCSAAYVISVALRAAKISVLAGGDKIMQRTFHAGVRRNLSILTARWERDIIYRFYPVIYPSFEESLRKAARVGETSSTWIPRTSEKQAPGRRFERMNIAM